MKKQCKSCKSLDKIVFHHTRYKKYGADRDIGIYLCETCHNFLHKFIKGNDPDLEMFTKNFLKGGKFWKSK